MDVCSENVHVGCGMVKSVQPQEMRMRLGRKKLILLTGPREGALHAT